MIQTARQNQTGWRQEALLDGFPFALIIQQLNFAQGNAVNLHEYPNRNGARTGAA
jgi:hypothetical protein